MKPFFYILICIGLLVSCKHEQPQPTNSQAAKKAIMAVLKAQEIAWNQHDLEGFMQGYWKNDSLKFYGSQGLTYGWENTLSNYKKNYPTKAESGELKFVINDLTKIENDTYYVMGEYHLTRRIGNSNGVFIIIFKKLDGQWKIIADMSC
ncbi:hypothetical protein IA57_07145 [Mangrovimonas yunxiaonensis]|uniref:DUF4440 domain-containing protein n=1 Tax=Mangrovimonas yunxiaonensis TaxID=1197477 RepID=A0A084TLL2_9FLAO|nr:nuclear transport factor 2 family protein [Mangrovimonas yunxiaonensis]KFB01598.1 hypothetical protein IA57_07145 [Mangrovimonas yunxiaonensis]